MNNNRAEMLIRELGLQPLPGEGGLFAEIYKARQIIPQAALGQAYDGDRAASTSIYYMLRHGEISALHRLCSDEVWHFYEGDPIELTTIDAVAGVALTQVLGEDIEAGQVRQAVLPAGCWFGGRLGEDGRSAGYALLGCTVAPGFEYQDFELGSRAQLIAQYPRHRQLIETLTRA